jgi:drug/metabolite transporter (DMT)-like permease
MQSEQRKQVGTALLIALSGFSLLSVGDAVVKSIAGEWPAPAVSALRYNFGVIGLAAAVALATICFFLGVMAMPLADATAIQFTSPILTAILSGMVLGERVPKAAWAAIAVAFLGVMIVLRPNFLELGGAAFYPLGAAFGMAWLITFNRKSAGDAPVLVMQFTLACVAAPLLLIAAVTLGAVAGPQFAIGWPSSEVIAKCALVAVTASTGHLMIYWATTHAGAAVVSPMTYVQLLVAAALGWAWFGDAPDLVTYLGAALIIGGGLLLWRSQKPREVADAPTRANLPR